MNKDFHEYYRVNQDAEKKLSGKLGLYWDNTAQDWDLINSDSSSIDAFLRAYKSLEDDDEKFVLMQLIAASFDDFETTKKFDTTLWDKCKLILEKEHALHIHTIYYWSSKEKDLDQFFLSPYMDKVYKKVKYYYS